MILSQAGQEFISFLIQQVFVVSPICIKVSLPFCRWVNWISLAPHSSALAWKIPWREEPSRLQSVGSLKSWTRLSDFPFTFHFHTLEKEMAAHSSVLSWRIPGTGEPGGLPSMGSYRVGPNWSDLAAAAIANWISKRINHLLCLSQSYNAKIRTSLNLCWADVWRTDSVLHFLS